MKFPTPQSALGRAVERALLAAVVAGLGYLLKDPAIGEGSLLYFAIKTAMDVINPNITNI